MSKYNDGHDKHGASCQTSFFWMPKCVRPMAENVSSKRLLILAERDEWFLTYIFTGLFKNRPYACNGSVNRQVWRWDVCSRKTVDLSLLVGSELCSKLRRSRAVITSESKNVAWDQRMGWCSFSSKPDAVLWLCWRRWAGKNKFQLTNYSTQDYRPGDWYLYPKRNNTYFLYVSSWSHDLFVTLVMFVKWVANHMTHSVVLESDYLRPSSFSYLSSLNFLQRGKCCNVN